MEISLVDYTDQKQCRDKVKEISSKSLYFPCTLLHFLIGLRHHPIFGLTHFQQKCDLMHTRWSCYSLLLLPHGIQLGTTYREMSWCYIALHQDPVIWGRLSGIQYSPMSLHHLLSNTNCCEAHAILPMNLLNHHICFRDFPNSRQLTST